MSKPIKFLKCTLDLLGLKIKIKTVQTRSQKQSPHRPGHAQDRPLARNLKRC